MFSPLYYRGCVIVLSCFHHYTIVFCVIVLSCFHHCPIVAASSCYHVFTTVLSWLRHRAIVFSPLFYRGCVIVLSCFHHCTILVSSSYCRSFKIKLSRFHHLAIVFSSSYYRGNYHFFLFFFPFLTTFPKSFISRIV